MKSDPSGNSLPTDAHGDLISALSGLEANRERDVAYRTRRVVMSSRGVMQEQKAGGTRARGVALAVTLVVLLLLGPLAWEFTDSLIAGEHLGDPGSELVILAFLVCSALLAATVVAGWFRKRS